MVAKISCLYDSGPTNVNYYCCYSESSDAVLEAHERAQAQAAAQAQAQAASSTTTNQTPAAQAGPSTSGYANTGVPEGLDPSFLAALPENIRAEVIADHLRMQRLQARTQEQQSGSVGTGGEPSGNGAMEVNAEFLAALPPAIQEEVRNFQLVPF